MSVFSLLPTVSPTPQGIWETASHQKTESLLLCNDSDIKHMEYLSFRENAQEEKEKERETDISWLKECMRRDNGLNKSFTVSINGSSFTDAPNLLSRIMLMMLHEANDIVTEDLLQAASTVEKIYLHRKGLINSFNETGYYYKDLYEDKDDAKLWQLIREQLKIIQEKRQINKSESKHILYTNNMKDTSQASHLIPSLRLLSNKKRTLIKPNFTTLYEIPKETPIVHNHITLTSLSPMAVPVIPPHPVIRELYPVVVMTAPTFSVEHRRLRVFATIERDIFHTAGVLRCMAPEAFRYGDCGDTSITTSSINAVNTLNVHKDSGLPFARQPFRWFIARDSGIFHELPRDKALTLSNSTTSLYSYNNDNSNNNSKSLLQELRRQCTDDTFLPLDSLLAIGIAYSWVLSSTPPITISLEIDLNPDKDLDHMDAVEITLLQRYWALCKKSASNVPLSNYTCLEEGVPYVVGVEVYFGEEENDDVMENYVMVLRDFVIPHGSNTRQTKKELRDLLDAPHRYR